jgi:hypothetical protein
MLRDPVMAVFPITLSEPVISAEPDAVRAEVIFKEFKTASEPLTITRFHDGINTNLLWLVIANVCYPLPLWAYNIVINIQKNRILKT